MTLLPAEREARDGAADGQLYAWVQPLYEFPRGRAAREAGRRGPLAKTARLWVDRRGQRPAETVFSLEHLPAAVAREVAEAINRGRA